VTQASGVVSADFLSPATATGPGPRQTWPRASLAPVVPLAWLYGEAPGTLVTGPQTPTATPPPPPGPGDGCSCA
jgi:hypothetical protein